MRFDFFEKLSSDEAHAFLRRFLSLESENIVGVLKQCSAEDIVADFSIESIAPFMRWMLTKLTTVRKSPDPQLPQWIRDTDSYAQNLFEFDEPSKILVLRAAYYLGESFVRCHRCLHWTIGNVETAEGNMPVVAGFDSGLELAPILIAENLFGRVIAEPTKLGDIEKAIEYWNQRASAP